MEEHRHEDRRQPAFIRAGLPEEVLERSRLALPCTERLRDRASRFSAPLGQRRLIGQLVRICAWQKKNSCCSAWPANVGSHKTKTATLAAMIAIVSQAVRLVGLMSRIGITTARPYPLANRTRERAEESRSFLESTAPLQEESGPRRYSQAEGRGQVGAPIGRRRLESGALPRRVRATSTKNNRGVRSSGPSIRTPMRSSIP